MPVAVRICPQHMTKQDYQRAISELEADGVPEGRMYHAAYGDDRVHVFEVWESQEHFDASRDRMVDLLQGATLDAGIVEVHPLHSEP